MTNIRQLPYSISVEEQFLVSTDNHNPKVVVRVNKSVCTLSFQEKKNQGFFRESCRYLSLETSHIPIIGNIINHSEFKCISRENVLSKKEIKLHYNGEFLEKITSFKTMMHGEYLFTPNCIFYRGKAVIRSTDNLLDYFIVDFFESKQTIIIYKGKVCRIERREHNPEVLVKKAAHRCGVFVQLEHNFGKDDEKIKYCFHGDYIIISNETYTAFKIVTAIFRGREVFSRELSGNIVFRKTIDGIQFFHEEQIECHTCEYPFTYEKSSLRVHNGWVFEKGQVDVDVLDRAICGIVTKIDQFPFFCKEFKSAILNILCCHKLSDEFLGKVPKDVILHVLLPYIAEIDLVFGRSLEDIKSQIVCEGCNMERNQTSNYV